MRPTKTSKVMAKTSKANLGDIIRADEFAYGSYKTDFNSKGHLVLVKDYITVDGKTKSHPVNYIKPDTPRDKPLEFITLETAAYDPSRAKAHFVVETAMMNGGTGPDAHDPYPDGWYIEARRLNPNGTYNPLGELIHFYQSGLFSCIVPEVERIGKMERVFVKKK